MLLHTAFVKPFGMRLFGVDMGKCEVYAPPGEVSCADELRNLLYSILFMNIFVGQCEPALGWTPHRLWVPPALASAAPHAQPDRSRPHPTQGHGGGSGGVRPNQAACDL